MRVVNDTNSVWLAKAKATDTEEFSEVMNAQAWSEFTLFADVTAITSGTLLLHIYTNADGDASGKWEQIAASALSITAVGGYSYTIPVDATARKNLSKFFRIGVAGSTLVGGEFSAWVTRRA